ncbi:AAA family ATPase [Mycetocola zhadangensis]|uniref:Nuclease SbcCD subunit C n=1 Tax=Mycetocola zhadangensis TaxID=1164595 RepID=A0A3L7J711_9MICO|nr:AAA family ATPase [Mycetocola zhadangensis]RLQ84292.1 SMC family ATPase [Mycetocola zhadangensis]GGE94332.1 nuclease SbcCD subunit C [Mycetocola zhadangensis]
MKIQRLTIAGFGPYKDEQQIDFERFDDDGIFLITGKTGAGKSSLLDAICFALYSGVPRYDGTQSRLRSDYCEPGDSTFVELQFTVHGTSYRVRRSPEYERPKKSGSGTTPQKATAELFRLTDGVWEGIAARPVDVATELDAILGLTKDQFLQVILLAQNRFQQFLLAKNDERQAVLRTLFGTKRFEQMELALVARSKDLAAQLDSSGGSLQSQAALAAGLVQQEAPTQPALAWFDEILAELTDAHARAAEAATVADAEFSTADAEHRALQDTRRRQLRRDSARSTLETFETQTEAIEADRETLDRARRASSVWAHVAARRGAESAHQRAVEAEKEKTERYSALLEGAIDIDAETLGKVIDELARSLGTLQGIVADERTLHRLRGEVERLEKVHADREADVAAATHRVAELPGQLHAVAEELSVAKVTAASLPEAKAKVARLEVARSAAQRAATLDRKLTEARFTEKDASAAHLAAATRLDELFTARLNGHAGELARALVAGDPCAVCGSPEHPKPASWDGDEITEADMAAARAAVADRRSELDDATAIAQDLATRLAAEQARAESKPLDEIDAELADATLELIDLETAAEQVVGYEARQAALRAELDTATESLTALRADSARASTGVAEAATRLTEATTRVTEHRSGFESVAERAAELERRLEAARDLLDAMATTQTRQAALAAATETLADQLAENDCADEAAVDAARRGAAEIASLDTRIREFDNAVASARSTLAEPELADLPADLIDLSAAESLVAETRSSRDAALQAASSLSERVGQLGAIVCRVRTEQEASAALREEYEHVRALASAVQGNEPNTKRMRLETYVLAAQLEEIVTAANARLGTMTSGRYTLQHDDSVQYRNTRSGLGLAILDEHTGRARPTHSLSGGETFLASLALALGLAEVVTNQAGGISLDTLFIDEGFGSLDGDTLEIAMSTLDSLRSGGRTIGLISHVDAMKEQIHAKLRIDVTDSGASRVAVSTVPLGFELV